MEAPLSFEHVPPRGAFNRTRAEMRGTEGWLKRDRGTGHPGDRARIQQRGSGTFSLCGPCNNRSARLYVPELIKWTRMGADILWGSQRAAERGEEAGQRTWVNIKADGVRPGRFLKQVVTMLLAMSPPHLGEIHPDLRAYAQDPEWIGMPSQFQIYLSLYSGPNARYVGGAGKLSGIGVGPIERHMVFEVAYPPFAYVLSVDE